MNLNDGQRRNLESTTAAQTGISVVVPVYGSAAILPHFVEILSRVMPELGRPFELVLINDGSRDCSWGVVSEISRQHHWIVGINLMRNFGQHNALLCGIRSARYDVVVTMDDDLQHPPEEIPKLLEKLEAGYEVVYGTPEKQQHNFWRDVASELTKFVLKGAMGADIARHVSAFRAFRTELRDTFANYRAPLVNIDVLLTWGASRFATVRVRHAPRHSGQSGYTFRKLLTHAVNMMTGFSTLPLRYASFMGFALTLFGLGVLCFVLVRFLTQGSSVPGFPFLASIIAIFSGAQLFALGIIGEYLARMYSRMMERPPYTVRSTTFHASSTSQGDLH